MRRCEQICKSLGPFEREYMPQTANYVRFSLQSGHTSKSGRGAFSCAVTLKWVPNFSWQHPIFREFTAVPLTSHTYSSLNNRMVCGLLLNASASQILLGRKRTLCFNRHLQHVHQYWVTMCNVSPFVSIG